MDVPPPVSPDDPGYEHILDNPNWGGSGPMHFDRDGHPISLRQWIDLHGREEYVKVASDYLDDGILWISTVWLGIDHSFGHGPPLFFETMVFVHATEAQLAERQEMWARLPYRGPPDRYPWEDLQCWRYSTEDQARAGHRGTVDSLRVMIESLDEVT